MVFLLFLTALLMNIPFGYWREGTLKFSFKWFFWIHASIPFLVYLRLIWHISAWVIPLSIFWAVVGQMIGSRLRRKGMKREEKERLEQIPDLNLSDIPVPGNETMVVLLNMGGPKTNDDVASFQKQLFSDPLLIQFPLSFLFQKIFAQILVTFRLKQSKARYQLIGGGSPIYSSTQAQAQALRRELKQRGGEVDIIFSFNYSPPFPEDTIKEIKEKGKKYLYPLSLYPHYSHATTGSNLHYLKLAAKKNYPELQFLNLSSYYLHDGYIGAFVDRIKEAVSQQESLDDFYLIFSAHGLPIYFLEKGDPYPFQIHQTVSKILTQLGRTRDWVISYQSAVGPFPWLKPSTDAILNSLASRNVTKILVIPISFVGDHIESLCEIDIEYRQMAQRLGIKDFRMTKALESHPKFIQALADCVEEKIKKEYQENRVSVGRLSEGKNN